MNEPATWTIVDAHKCSRCGYLDQTRDGIMAHLAEHDAPPLGCLMCGKVPSYGGFCVEHGGS